MDRARVSLRTADVTDREVILDILDEAASWLEARGVKQWPSPFPRSTVDHDLRHNTVLLAALDGDTIATASILTEDPMFWGDLRGSAWYLHRFAVQRRGAGVGHAVLSEIEAAGVESGVDYVRLDCGVRLQPYYEAAGYQLRSAVSLLNATSSPPRSLWFCYEKLLRRVR